MHGAITRNDDTRRHVADDARQQDSHVEDRQNHRLPQTAISPAEVQSDVVVLVQRTIGRVGTVCDGSSRQRYVVIQRRRSLHVGRVLQQTIDCRISGNKIITVKGILTN